MIFHSLDFLIYFPIVLLFSWLIPFPKNNLFLLVASYVFYAYATPVYSLLLLFLTVITFFSALIIDRSEEKRKLGLFIGIGIPFAVLIYFKYSTFLLGNLAALFGKSLSQHPGILPVGISFFTFQAASYVFDVSRKALPATNSFSNYALYKAFFPQLVAGPIERSTHLLPQIERKRVFKLENVKPALILILWGYFKKLVIADNLATVVNKVFALQDPSFPLIWSATLAFGMQIYADFSAYSDIARGCARLLGIELMENFRNPYVALTPAEFWRRWHISLSTWFRDYLYIPLGGSRDGFGKTFRNVAITFLLCGLWHGASWNYVIWGAYHGVLVSFSSLLEILPKAFRWLLTFILIHIGWLLFRETNLHMLFHDLSTNPFGADWKEWLIGLYFAVVAILLSIPLWLQPVAEKVFQKLPQESNTRCVIESVLAGVGLAAILLLSSDSQSDFIYFAF
jgi:alginate O-acetyltransferase complex protein AlgI